MKKKICVGIALGILSAQPVLATTIDWVDWTGLTSGGNPTGTVNGLTVTYTGPYSFLELNRYAEKSNPVHKQSI